MLLVVLGHQLRRARRVALKRGTLSCLRLLLLIVNALLVFTLLM